jgi:misacylated tRNA(Ala) deacylase
MGRGSLGERREVGGPNILRCADENAPTTRATPGGHEAFSLGVIGGPVTELAYLADMPSAYVRSFRARVVALPPGSVVLDRTYFYPVGGGQPADRGTLSAGSSRATVVDVSRSGGSVVHRLRLPAGGGAGFAVGIEVEGTIDWARRHRHMRLHTGQHLLSARVFERTGLRTRKALLKDAGATIDLEGALDASTVDAMAQDMNDLIRQGRTVTIRHLPRAEWDAIPAAGRSGLVPLAPSVDPVRVVEIDGLDDCPCGGTHVRSTAEIGEVLLTPPTELPEGGMRLGFTLVRPDAPTPPE